MKGLFLYLGDMAMPYRTIMSEHSDFTVKGTLIPKRRVVIAEQTHSAHVHVCTETDGGAGFDTHGQIADCDGLVTNVPGLFLLIRTADCTPVLLYDETAKAVGAAHSGREGTRQNIAQATVSALAREYSARPGNLYARIGAGICKQHYEVSPALWKEFAASCAVQGIHVPDSDLPCLDIKSVIRQQLIRAGLNPGRIEVSNCCTYESDRHFSYRRDKTRNRQINLIGIIDG